MSLGSTIEHSFTESRSSLVHEFSVRRLTDISVLDRRQHDALDIDVHDRIELESANVKRK